MSNSDESPSVSMYQVRFLTVASTNNYKLLGRAAATVAPTEVVEGGQTLATALLDGKHSHGKQDLKWDIAISTLCVHVVWVACYLFSTTLITFCLDGEKFHLIVAFSLRTQLRTRIELGAWSVRAGNGQLDEIRREDVSSFGSEMLQVLHSSTFFLSFFFFC